MNRYIHTLRHLKPIQIYGRLWFRLFRPRSDLRPSPPLRVPWAKPVGWAARQPSMTGLESFLFLNKEGDLSLGWDPPCREKLWRYNLHYFDDLNAVGGQSRQEWHRRLIARWIAENPPGKGSGWEPYPLSLRIVNWIKWALAGNRLSGKVLQSLAVQVRFLRRRLEIHLLGNHLFANAKALIFAGLFFEGAEAEAWLDKGLQILERELSEQVLTDGGHFERSPMYHAIILEDLLDLINIMQTYGRSVPADWYETAGQMVRWLENMSHPDGEIALFNDAATSLAPGPAALRDYSMRLGLDSRRTETSSEGLTHLEASGYIRWAQGEAVAFLDVGPIGPDYLPGHAHADTLSFELSLYGMRVIVDSGTSCYGESSERLRQRGTAAHNTVAINGCDSSEVWGGFRVARRAKPFGLNIEQGRDTTKIVCSHDGYCRLPGKPVHQREWFLREKELRIRDRIHGRFGTAVGRFHFHPKIVVETEKSSTKGKLVLPGGKAVHWEVLDGKCFVVRTTYHPEFGISQSNYCLEIMFTRPELEIVFSWS